MSTKAGVHVTFGGRNGYGEVAAAVPAAVTAVGEGGALTEVREKSNGRTITIYREQTVYFDAPNGIDQMTTAQARQTADDNWPALKAAYQQNPADYYQVTNETGGDNAQSLANIAAFETRLMELAERDGFKLAVASPAGGSPGIWENWVTHFVPLIRRAGEGGHIYSRHAYGGVAPGGNGFMTKVEGGSILPADDNAGRPFKEAAFLRSQGILTPMVLTEVGPNGGFNFPGADALLEDVARYDQLCQQHENIWAFCLFTYGNFQNANIQDASAALAHYLQSKGGAVRPVYPVSGDASSGTVNPGTSADDTAVTPPDFIPFDSPVGTESERRSPKIYPAGWLDANPFKNRYINPTTGKEAFHTGSDLNKAADLDRDAPVCAAADGVVTCAQSFNVWGNVIVIRHADTLFSRYGHVQKMLVVEGDMVTRGQHIANVGQDAGGGPFHLHFDISHTAVLGTKANHWPGLDLPELEANYVDPAEYIRTHRPPNAVRTDFLWEGRVKATLGVNLRTEPSAAQGELTVKRGLSFGSMVQVLEELGDWYRVRAGNDEGFVAAKWVERQEGEIETTTGTVPAVGGGQTFDLLSYLQGDGRAYMVRSQQTGNQELVFSAANNGRFYTCKGEFHFVAQGVVCNWEEMWQEDGFIMRGIDTSPDENRFYIQREPGRDGSRWVKRHMRVGESVKSNPFVQFYLKKDGSKHSDNSGPAHNTITLVQHHNNLAFPSGITCEDVIELKWEEGKEVYFYMKNVGLVGWKGLHDGHTPTVNTVSEWLSNRPLPKRLQIPAV